MPRVRRQVGRYEHNSYFCRCGCGKRIQTCWGVYYNAACRKRFQRARDREDRERDEALQDGRLYSRHMQHA